MEPSAAGSETSSQANCDICKGPQEDPCRLSVCGHVFCRQCLIGVLSFREHCPLCRKKAQAEDIVPITDTGANGSAQTRRLQRTGCPLPGLTGPSTPQRPVSHGIQSLIRQLQSARQRMASSSDMTTPAPSVAAAPAPAHPPAPVVTPPPRNSARGPTPIPMPRRRIHASSVDSLPRAAVPPPSPSVSSSSSSSFSSSHDVDDVEGIMFDYQMRQLNQPGQSSLMVRMFTCPYCQEDGLDEFDLKDHCNENHHQDNRSVVCPVCSSLPHGIPTQYSRNFIGHLNLRHCYYSEDYTNVHQSDMLNEQDAIFESFQVAMQSGR